MTTRPAYRRPKTAASAEPSRRPVIVVALVAVAVIVLIGVVIALAAGGRDEGDDAAAVDPFGSVTVTGTPLPGFTSTDADPAVGDIAPTLEGEGLDGRAVTVGGAAEPTLVVFLAHWCPHCQAELPILVDLESEGAFEGVHLVGVLTGTNPDAPNYPPGEWLEREGWTGEVMLDDRASAAAAAYGIEGYPFMVALDSEGRVTARTSGELPPEDVEALADAARGVG